MLRSHIIYYWNEIKSSYWFLPTLLSLAAILIALVLPKNQSPAKRVVPTKDLLHFPLLFWVYIRAGRKYLRTYNPLPPLFCLHPYRKLLV